MDLTLSFEKSKFGIDEIVVVGHLCRTYEGNLEKVDAIARMKTCSNITEVRRFLGACVFYQIWVPHFAHLAEPLYRLLGKETKFRPELAREGLKGILKSPPILRQVDYDCNTHVVITVDISPIAISWAVG